MSHDLILVGDQAMTPEEYASYRKLREYRNAWKRNKWATDPEFRARRRAYNQEWRTANLDLRRAYNRDWMRRKRAGDRPQLMAVYSLHDMRCTGPTKATGCRCRKVTIYERVAA